jgi:hypothetical protein
VVSQDPERSGDLIIREGGGRAGRAAAGAPLH